MKLRLGPDGVHLFDRTTGINVLIDEVHVSSTMWAKAPRTVSVALTNACDLRCPYCYAPKDGANLDIRQLVEWIAELDRHGCLGIGLGGGEPTLYKDFSRLCRYTTQYTNLAVTFTTHGHHIDQHLVAELSGNVNFIRMSMDGVGVTYEALRGRRFADFQNQLDLVRRLAPFGINYVVNAQTIPDLDAAIAFASEQGAVEFLLLPERPVHGCGGIDFATREYLNNWVETYDGSIRLAVSENDAEGMPTCDPLEMEDGLQSYAHIDARGTLKRSSYDTFGISIGSDGILKSLNQLRQTTTRT